MILPHTEKERRNVLAPPAARTRSASARLPAAARHAHQLGSHEIAVRNMLFESAMLFCAHSAAHFPSAVLH